VLQKRDDLSPSIRRKVLEKNAWRFYPVPQNALYVSAVMNVLKFPKGKR
jgi:hypothetical protein